MTTLTPTSFAAYKTLYPNDKELQQLTLEELFRETGGRHVDWSKITYKRNAPYLLASSGWDCGVGIGYVVFDCLCLFLGAASLRASFTAKAAAEVGAAAAPVLSQLTKYIQTIKAASSSKTEVATAVFGVVSTIYSGGCLSAVLKAFLGSLEWYQGVLYGATALGTILAAVCTDGAAEVGLIIVELATAGFLIDDSIKCADACSIA